MTTQQVPTHPVIACAHTIEKALASVGEVQPCYLSVRDKQDALLALARAEARIAELKLRVLACADDVAEQTGARDAGGWLAHATNVTHHQAYGELRLAQTLDTRYQRVAAGMREGRVNLAQARVIVAALDTLPVDLDPITKARAEKELVRLAGVHDPKALKILGDKILEVVAPDIADEALGKALEREEQRAQTKCSLKIRSRGDGTSRISGVLPDAAAARLTTYLEAMTSPRVSTSSTNVGCGERIPRHRAMGQAFCTLIEHLDPHDLPEHGGDATSVTVVIDLETLLNQLGSATLDAGIDGQTLISAADARRLACNARIIPAVLGGKGEVLDLGRAQRLYSTPQRKAMALRDQHCRAEGCTIPARWTEAHHLKPWSHGGNTNLADGVLLCSHHHHRAHDTRYAMSKLTNGDYRFHRRT